NTDDYTQITEGSKYDCNPRFIRSEVTVNYRMVTGMTSGETTRVEDREETPVYGYDKRRSYTVRIRDSRGSKDWRTVASFTVTENENGTGNGGSGTRIDDPSDPSLTGDFGSPKDALNAVLAGIRKKYPYPIRDTAVVKYVKPKEQQLSENKLSVLLQRIGSSPLYSFDAKDSLRGAWYDDADKRIYFIPSGERRDWSWLNIDEKVVNEYDAYQFELTKLFGIYDENSLQLTFSKNGAITRKELKISKLEHNKLTFEDGTYWKRVE
ncbi:MAG TPA: hypothetical protein VI233_06040, partial [Puia sp.]